MFDFVEINKTVRFSEIINKNYSLSAQQYKKINLDEKKCKSIKELLINNKVITGKEVGSSAYVKQSDYIYIRTKGFGKNLYNLDLSISESHSFIKPKSYSENVGKNNLREAKKGDILFATGGDVGNCCYVSRDLKNNVISSHIIKLNFGSLQYYLLAILKSNLIKEQVLLAPSGGIKGLDTFSDEYLLNALVPFPSKKENYDKEVNYVSHLSKMNVLIENALFNKINEINFDIENELKNNQKESSFVYSYPKIKEIIEIGRLDTLRYSKLHKEKTYLISNYKHGKCHLTDLGYEFQRGQNLQISNIGISIYSSIYKDNFYSLTLSKNFTKYCTYTCDEYIGNKASLNELKKGDIVFSSRGDYGRVTIVLNDLKKTITNIDNIIITNHDDNVSRDIAICLLLNWYRENGFIKTIGFVGSGADSLTQGQIDSIPIPLFPKSFINKISSKYLNNYKVKDIKEETVLNLIEKGGIANLEEVRLIIRNRINDAIVKIVNNQTVDCNLAIR